MDSVPAEQELLAGTVLAGRYRIVHRLGGGGMGEVYRADDLELGEPVALKLLIGAGEGATVQRDRLRAEVRLARRVTHPGVCRVFDLAEADGRLFLSMEWIDGEDLGSLLRRIGRLPAERVLRAARQLTSSLAAVHEQGLLHRDLKPANVMVDGRGRARLTDFGLADTREAAKEDLAGTPAYMAPEQFTSGGSSAASDLWALGALLHEMLTGAHPYPHAASLDELRATRSEPPRPLDAKALGADPDLCELIHACLQPDPSLRPGSAAEAYALLPGGDPLNDSLEAGDTPSPDALARAGPRGDLPRAAGRGLLATVVVGLCGFLLLVDHATQSGLAQPTLSPDVLVDRAQKLLEQTRPGDAPEYRASLVGMFEYANDLAAQNSATTADPASIPVGIRYAVSPEPMRPDEFGLRELLAVPGTAVVDLDMAGRLLTYAAHPRREELAPSTDREVANQAWTALLEAAGLDPTTLVEEPPEFAPPIAFTSRRAWRAKGAGASVVGAAGSHPLYFAIRRTEAPPAPLAGSGFRGAIASILLVGLVLAGWLARRQARAGRVDFRGAWRFAALIAATRPVAALLVGPYPSGDLVGWAVAQLETGLLMFALSWVLFVALEPEIRRGRPRSAIALHRFLAGRFADPLIAREVLIGLAAGTAIACLALVEIAISQSLFGTANYWYEFGLHQGLTSRFGVLGTWLSAFGVVALLGWVPLLGWSLTRRFDNVVVASAAAVAPCILLTVVGGTGALGVVAVLWGCAWAWIALRHGYLAAVVFSLSRALFLAVPYTMDRERFYFGNSIVLGVLVLATAVWAYRLSTRTLPSPVLNRG